MLSWAAFFVVAIIAALLGYTSIAGSAVEIAKILFLVMAVVALFYGRTRSI